MSELSRRQFARLLALTGSATLLPRASWGHAPLASPAAAPGESYWAEVRDQFLMPRELAPMNAANLCPAPRPVVESLERWSRSLESDPAPGTRGRLGDAREETRRLVAGFLGVTPEEIVITRNTSEANNLVSSGLTLGPNDEVLLWAENHPSNLMAWREKAKRYGFTVTVVPAANPHPGADYWIETFSRALTPRTRVLSFTHVTNSVGDVFPAAELCRIARDRGVLTLVDGAQTFGVFAVNLAEMKPDFYSGSAHKWLCGPKETGVLYVNREVQDRLTASVFSLYPGRVGASRALEGFGQRDEPALAALGEAIRFQTTIGRDAIERRSRELAHTLAEELRRLDGVTVWTHADPARSGAVVTFRAGTLDPRRLLTALYEKHRIVGAARGGEDRPGVRLSPHVYNLPDEIERAVAAVRGFLRSGV
jgi:selenocysteine lyase/cysteine desulfurase